MRAFYDDAHLVEKAQGGDRGALEQLIALHRAKVHHVALTILRDPELADEVVGEVLGHLPTTILSFNGRARFATWIHQVTRNRAISEQRKQPKSLSVPLTDAVVAPTVTLPTELSRGLPPRDRAVLELRARGHTHSEVAAALGSTESAVKTRYHRLRKRLRLWHA